MEKSRHTAWVRHFDVLGDELLRLTTICGVDLREPEAIEKVLKNDQSVCKKRNAIGFKKLRELLMAIFNSLEKAGARLGTSEVQVIAEQIRQRLDARRALASGTAKGTDHA